MHFSFTSSAQYAYSPNADTSASPVVMVQLKPQLLPFTTC